MLGSARDSEQSKEQASAEEWERASAQGTALKKDEPKEIEWALGSAMTKAARKAGGSEEYSVEAKEALMVRASAEWSGKAWAEG